MGGAASTITEFQKMPFQIDLAQWTLKVNITLIMSLKAKDSLFKWQVFLQEESSLELEER